MIDSCITTRWDTSLTFALGEFVINLLFIVCAVSTHGADTLSDFLDESDIPFRVVYVGFRRLDRMDLKGGAVYGNVNFTPCATLTEPVLFNLPFDFAENFQPSGINEKMKSFAMIIDLDRNIESFRSFAYRRVGGSGQAGNP